MNKTEQKKYLSGIIVEYMRINNLDQREMAKKLNIQESTLSTWLNPDGHGISLKHAERIRFICHDIIDRHNKSINKVNNSSGTVNICTAVAEDFKNRAITGIIHLDIDPVAKDAVLKFLSSMKLEKK